MSVEIFMRKRRAKEGEIGLFVESEVFEDDWSSVKIGAEVAAELSVPVDPKYRKFFHGLCGKLAHAVEWFNGDKDFAKEQILLQCRHATYHHDKLRNKTEIRAKTTANLDADGWIRLLRRANYVCVSQYLPGMAESTLKSEIEQMLGMGPLDLSTPPAQPKQRRTRAAKQSLAEGQPNRGEVVDSPDKRVEHGEARDPEHVAPVDSPPPEGRPEGPTNEEEYIAACRSWIKKQTASHEDARSYFEGDHHVALRQKCGVKIGTRNMLRRELAEHYERTSDAQETKAG